MVKAPYLDHSFERIYSTKIINKVVSILLKKKSLIKRKIIKLEQIY